MRYLIEYRIALVKFILYFLPVSTISLKNVKLKKLVVKYDFL